jgi:hypothetical protein
MLRVSFRAVCVLGVMILAWMGSLVIVAERDALAGSWALVSCAGSSADAGWASFSEGAPPGGSTSSVSCSPGMKVGLPEGALAGAAEGLVFTAPGGETIVGGEITVVGSASIDPGFSGEPGGQEGLLSSPSESDAFIRVVNVKRTEAIPVGGTRIWAREVCSGSDGPTCGWGSISIPSAYIVLSPSTTPSVSALAGSLTTSGSQHGTQDVSFTATDPNGPGIYQVTVTIDGKVTYQATPNLNGGACSSVGSYGTALEFSTSNPCPQSVSVTVPIQTGTLPDGIHSLLVTATDAAGDVSSASQAIFRTENLISTAGAGRVARTGSGGEPAYLVRFDGRTDGLLRGVRRSYADSALTLSGTLTTPQGAVAPDVQVRLFARDGNGSGMETLLASTTSNAAGHWSLTAPKGPSRTLRIGYGQASAANTPADTAVKESVSPTISLRIRDETGGHLSFTGRVSVRPLDRPYPIVVIEASSDGRHWQIVGRQVRTSSEGVFHLSYSSAFSVGGRFAFRASTPETSLWLQDSTKERWLRVR